MQEPCFGQHPPEAWSCVVGEDVRGILRLQRGLHLLIGVANRAGLICEYHSTLHGVFRVLVLEPINLYLYCRALLHTRLFGDGLELDDLVATQTPTTVRGT